MAERADAARNRQAILEAAGRLFDDATDPRRVSTDDIARAAGVGKGTLFRRFGDRTSLLRAIYDVRLAELRAAIESGAPPFGPESAPRQRIAAILDAIVAFKLDNRLLATALEQDQSGGAPTLYHSPGYVAMHTLLCDLLMDVVGAEDASWLAYALLAVTRIDLVDHLVTAERVTPAQLRDNLDRFVGRLLGDTGRG